MPAPRPTAVLRTPGHNTPKGGNRAYRSTCKLCPNGVYTGQPAVWLRKPAGLSHTECVERAGIEVPA